MPPLRAEASIAERIVNSLIDDLKDRSGLGDAWDGCDDDIKVEIAENWVTKIEEQLKDLIELRW